MQTCAGNAEVRAGRGRIVPGAGNAPLSKNVVLEKNVLAVKQHAGFAPRSSAHLRISSCTGGKNDIGMIRLDFPGYTGEGKLTPISWDEWFEKFDEQELALVSQETTADGEKSNFNKLVSRESKS